MSEFDDWLSSLDTAYPDASYMDALQLPDQSVYNLDITGGLGGLDGPLGGFSSFDPQQQFGVNNIADSFYPSDLTSIGGFMPPELSDAGPNQDSYVDIANAYGQATGLPLYEHTETINGQTYIVDEGGSIVGWKTDSGQFGYYDDVRNGNIVGNPITPLNTSVAGTSPYGRGGTTSRSPIVPQRTGSLSGSQISSVLGALNTALGVGKLGTSLWGALGKSTVSPPAARGTARPVSWNLPTAQRTPPKYYADGGVVTPHVPQISTGDQYVQENKSYYDYYLPRVQAWNQAHPDAQFRVPTDPTERSIEAAQNMATANTPNGNTFTSTPMNAAQSTISAMYANQPSVSRLPTQSMLRDEPRVERMYNNPRGGNHQMSDDRMARMQSKMGGMSQFHLNNMQERMSPQAPTTPVVSQPNPASTWSGSNQRVAPQYYANGGSIGGLGHVRGSAGGQDDVVDIKAAPGEYVMDAETVSALGDGNTQAGAKKLDEMRYNVRKHKRSGGLDSIPPKSKSIDRYMKGK